VSTKDSIDRFRTEFLQLRSARQSDEPGWLSLVRTQALERFLDKSFPTLRDEEWRFTNVAPIASGSFEAAPVGSDSDGESLKKRFQIEQDSHDLVFVNGRFSRELSSVGELADGVVATSLNDALSEHGDKVQPILSRGGGEDTAFFDLNEAFLSDGAFVYVPKGVVVERPIQLIFLSLASGKPMVVHPRNVVISEAETQVQILETYAGVDEYSSLRM
jgi:Fe-S cluster assembly protein SufD